MRDKTEMKCDTTETVWMKQKLYDRKKNLVTKQQFRKLILTLKEKNCK